jgi:hypothetical protein
MKNGLFRTKSRLRKKLIIGGADVTASRRAGRAPLPLKCWRQVLTGGENRLPSRHSKIILFFSSFQIEVEPLPSTTKIISSNSIRCGFRLLPGAISLR